MHILKAVMEHDVRLLPELKKYSNPEEYARQWALRYTKDRQKGPISLRTPRKRDLKSDPALSQAVAMALNTDADGPKVRMLREAHRMFMAAENVIGQLLEEYIGKSIEKSGWLPCWGYAVQHVDFVGPKNELLQVKNKSNSENSASARVRVETSIQKWHRLNANDGSTNWPELRKLTGTLALSEASFVNYVKMAVKTNPNLIAVAKSSPK